MFNEKNTYTHLNYRERAIIEHALNNKATFTDIAKTLGRNKSTIAREVQKNFSILKANHFNNESENSCVKRTTCKKTNLCTVCTERHKKCSSCKRCNLECPDYDPVCTLLKKAPYVCNGCKKKSTCKLERRFYNADKAEKLYRAVLKTSRNNSAKKTKFVKLLDAKITPHLEKGKSIHNFLITQPDFNCVARSTVYRWAQSNYFSIDSDNMPNTRKRKASKDYAYPRPKSKHILANRTYEDYLKRVEIADFYETVQIDTVIGKRSDSKVILTIYFVKNKFLLAYLLRSRTAKAVKEVIDNINQKLEKEKMNFGDIAPVILVDNGVEFSDPLALELSNDGEICSSVFYCTPYTVSQRPQIERAHVELRKFLPKGMSFEDLTQKELDLIMAHLNSYKLASLNSKSPHETFAFTYGDKVLKALNIELISDHEIVRCHKAIKRLLPKEEDKEE